MIDKRFLTEYLDESDYIIYSKEHRRGSSFYTSVSYKLDDADIEVIKEKTGVQLRKGAILVGHGVWDDDNGMEFMDVNLSEEVVKIIPAHTIEVPESKEISYITYKE